MTIDELIENFQAQHAEKMEEFTKVESELQDPVLNPYGVTKIDFGKREDLRVDIIKLEGAIEALQLFKTL
jgi:hypothetical protein